MGRARKAAGRGERGDGGKAGARCHLDNYNCSAMPAAYRIDGEMIFTESEPLNSDELLAMAEEVMTDRNRTQFKETNDTDLAYSLPTGDRFRINVFRDLNGVGIVARVIPANILTFEQLNLPPIVADFSPGSGG